ncbi:hypothetical protein MVEN_00933500 [Mycena venus]|uniref:Uncharacterized protein n=1 Tax=Mycena venus TaxID=2733690 RepID=A0A8H7D284_9AGAR|nr:hypothetical protein MVEN_00933500 [Mycena venus]
MRFISVVCVASTLLWVAYAIPIPQPISEEPLARTMAMDTITELDLIAKREELPEYDPGDHTRRDEEPRDVGARSGGGNAGGARIIA